MMWEVVASGGMELCPKEPHLCRCNTVAAEETSSGV